jgi:hypothetical protein
VSRRSARDRPRRAAFAFAVALTCVESQNAAKKPRKLRDLAKELLGMDIQGGEQ